MDKIIAFHKCVGERSGRAEDSSHSSGSMAMLDLDPGDSIKSSRAAISNNLIMTTMLLVNQKEKQPVSFYWLTQSL